MKMIGGMGGWENGASQSPNPPIPQSSLRSWLQLLRFPNLLTVPGDPIAGYLLAGGAAAGLLPNLLLVLVASLLFYAAGLLINDVVDLSVDRHERPRRPLPAGCASPTLVRNVAFTLLAVALGICFFVGDRTMRVGATLTTAILGYNFFLKRNPIFGPLAMGLCRALNLLLGASVVGVGPPLLVGASATLTAYISMVTYVARGEVRSRKVDASSWLPPLVILTAMAFFLRVSTVSGVTEFRMAGAFFLAFLLASMAALRAPKPEAVGLMISALLPMQAAFCLGANAGHMALLAALLLLVLWPVNRLLSRWFYGS